MISFLSVAALAYTATVAGEQLLKTIYSLEDLALDENDHLAQHWLIYPSGKCDKVIQSVWNDQLSHAPGVRQIAAVFPEDLKTKFFPGYNAPEEQSNCYAICIDRGVPGNLLDKPLPEKFFRQSSDNLSIWMNEECLRVETGWTSYHKNKVDIYWENPRTGQLTQTGKLDYGERHTVWQHTTLGHVFVLKDAVTGEVMERYEVAFNGFRVVGDSGSMVQPMNNTQKISNTLYGEWDRSQRVKRTFTEFGFNKGRLPDDLWASLQAYYYNNKKMMHREEWETKGVHVNWWERDAFMIGMPWKLKRMWQTRLKDLVEDWIGGVPLENTDIYGMRRYEDGARLLTHVDREATHAASMIINIDQGNIRKPWMVEIYDFGNRLHEIEMEPGDIVFYESARCLHGRMAPLEGDYYVNLFTHYRPEGDPEWFLKENPQGTAEQALDVGFCQTNPADPSKTPVCSGKDAPTLSPAMQKLSGPNDLFTWWNLVGKGRWTANISPVGDWGTQAHSEL